LPAILETPLDGPDDDRINLWKAVELAVAVGAAEPMLLEQMPTGPVETIKTTALARTAKKVRGMRGARRRNSVARRKGKKVRRN